MWFSQRTLHQYPFIETQRRHYTCNEHQWSDPWNFTTLLQGVDTIDHLSLLQKLYKINFSVEALKLIQSYILERRKYVQIDDKTSSTQLNNFGVPQGSILGLVLFNLYIVDIVDNISCNSLQYADDTTLYQHCKLKNLQNCIEKLESDLQTVSDWALKNSLVLMILKQNTCCFRQYS